MTKQAAPKLRDAERTRSEILAAAAEEFGSRGFGGARVDAVAERAGASKRMIYHYFVDKEGLYDAVLEAAYAEVRVAEAALDLQALSPVDALRRLVEHTFDYDESHPAFVRLVAAENLDEARGPARTKPLQTINAEALSLIEGVLRRGRAEGVFSRDVEPLDLHLLISALCFFRVANRHTFGVAFGVDLTSPTLRDRHRRMAVEVVLARVGVRQS
jgi:AcrR family transcriptional regulator